MAEAGRSSSSSTSGERTTGKSRATGRTIRRSESAISSRPEERRLIAVELFLDPDGCLRHLQAEGHAAGAARGGNIVCAAATVLIRTAARLLDGIVEIDTEGGAEREGRLSIRVNAVPDERRQWLRGVTDSLFRGLTDLGTEYPDRISLRILDFEE